LSIFSSSQNNCDFFQQPHKGHPVNITVTVNHFQPSLIFAFNDTKVITPEKSLKVQFDGGKNGKMDEKNKTSWLSIFLEATKHFSVSNVSKMDQRVFFH
jgi:hypothetical protein